MRLFDEEGTDLEIVAVRRETSRDRSHRARSSIKATSRTR